MAEATEVRAEEIPEGEEVTATESRKYVSERGPFEIWDSPPIKQPFPSEKVNVDKAPNGFEYSQLAAVLGEDLARQKVGEMVQAFSSGASTTPLFAQRTENGMSLYHVWFGANFPLFRHSHPAYGDCLYYVVAGEVLLGNRRLKAGAGFFVPNGQPYKYRAGPAGVELLEFRAGGGDADAPGMKLDERSLASMQKIIDTANHERPNWVAPDHIGDTAFRQREFDFG